jgi:hypothetical protein
LSNAGIENKTEGQITFVEPIVSAYMLSDVTFQITPAAGILIPTLQIRSYSNVLIKPYK